MIRKLKPYRRASNGGIAGHKRERHDCEENNSIFSEKGQIRTTH